MVWTSAGDEYRGLQLAFILRIPEDKIIVMLLPEHLKGNNALISAVLPGSPSCHLSFNQEVQMYRSIIIFLLLIFLASSTAEIFAIEKLYTDNRGFRHYSCGANMRGAHIAIKDLGRDRFRVQSSIYGGILSLPKDEAESSWCTGLIGAVRVLCGYCRNPEYEGSREEKIKRLGLHEAEE